MKRRLVLFLMAILALAGAASASVQKGDTELEVLGGFLSESGGTNGADLTSWFASGAFNYFLSDKISVGVGGFGANVQLDGTSSTIEVDVGEGVPLNAIFSNVDRDITAYGVGGRVKLHFATTNRWVPYIGAQAYWVNATVDTTGEYIAETSPGGGEFSPAQSFSESFDSSGLMWGPIGGVRIEINEYNDLFVEGQYHLWTGDIGDVFDSGYGIFVGIVHQFQ
jgi:opacity protein-like surface antigen